MFEPTLPRSIADQSLPIPNVYFVTVTHAASGVHSFYVAADDSRAAVAKVRRHCADTYGFRPYRVTTDIKMRRFLLGDYLEHPQGLQQACDMAAHYNERSTLGALEGRMAYVQSVLQDAQGATQVDFDAVADRLSEELRRVEARCA